MSEQPGLSAEVDKYIGDCESLGVSGAGCAMLLGAILAWYDDGLIPQRSRFAWLMREYLLTFPPARILENINFLNATGIQYPPPNEDGS